MVSITPWLEITIAGAVYVAAACILFLSFADKRNFTLTDNTRPLIPYIAVMMLFFSYVVGLSIHYLTVYVLVSCHPEFGFDAARQLGPYDKDMLERLAKLGSAYGTMVMFRLLFPGFFFLAISVLVWYWTHSNRRLRWSAVSICLAFSLFFLCTWLVHKDIYIQVRDAVFPK
jgi:hypothetical protein